jgi:hypothetical protein
MVWPEKNAIARIPLYQINSDLVCVSNIAEFVDPDPGHSFQAIREQIFGQNDTSENPPPMNGFAQQAESMAKGFSKTVMSGFRYVSAALVFATWICSWRVAHSSANNKTCVFSNRQLKP